MLTGRRPCVEREETNCADECRSRLSCSFEQRRRREEKCVHRPRFPTAHRVVCSLDAQLESRLFVASATRISASRFAKHFREATNHERSARVCPPSRYLSARVLARKLLCDRRHHL